METNSLPCWRSLGAAFSFLLAAFPGCSEAFSQASCVPNLPLRRWVLVHLRARCGSARQRERGNPAPAPQLSGFTADGLSLSPERTAPRTSGSRRRSHRCVPQLLAGIPKRGSRPSLRSRGEERRVCRRLGRGAEPCRSLPPQPPGTASGPPRAARVPPPPAPLLPLPSLRPLPSLPALSPRQR